MIRFPRQESTVAAKHDKAAAHCTYICSKKAQEKHFRNAKDFAYSPDSHSEWYLRALSHQTPSKQHLQAFLQPPATMGEYDFTESDTLADIETKIFLAKEALQVAKETGGRKKSTSFLQTHIQGKIDALETRKEALQNSSSTQNVEGTEGS